MSKVVVACAIAALSSGQLTFAWGADAHRTIGLIADKRLTPHARAQVRDLLAANVKSFRDLGMLHGATWVLAAHPERSAWRFVHVPAAVAALDFVRECAAPEHCIVWAIRHCSEIVADTNQPRAARIDALSVLVVLVSDIHNPLSVSYAADDGGRETYLDYFGKCSDLRTIWDDEIYRRAKVRPDQLAEEMIDRLPNARILEWQRELSPEAWADESFELTRTSVYFGIPPSGELWHPYQKRNWPVVQDRLAAAGVRLAALLNALFPEP